MKRTKEVIHKIVKEKYSQAALASQGCCSAPSACQTSMPVNIMDLSKRCGYTEDQLNSELSKANLGLGCGNPLSLAGLKPGERVLDLGSGPGFDAFLSAQAVGETGYVIGVDMTQEMAKSAHRTARKTGRKNVAFILGEIENLPVGGSCVDLVLSNCVINLSHSKKSVYREIFRVLRPGGRMVISDVLRSGEIPEKIRKDPAAYSG